MRGMEKAVCKGAVFIGALLGMSAGAFAQTTCTTSQDPRICVEVVAPGSRTYSQPELNPPQMTFVTYRVTINNGAASSLNRIAFSGTVTGTSDFVDPATGFPVFSGTSPTAYPVSPSGANITCTLASATSIQCGGLGVSLAANTALSFDLMVNTPNLPALLPLSPDQIILSWTAKYGEGGTTIGNGDTTVTGSAVTTLAAPGNEASANFPATGGVLATASDEFYTRVRVPNIGKNTSVSIKEAPIPAGSALSNCNSFKICQSSDISIPGVDTSVVGGVLTFELRMDASNIKKGTKIESVLIYYTGTNAVTPYLVDICPQPETPLASGLPCIAERIYYRNKTMTGGDRTLEGDYYWRLISYKNGLFQFF